MSGGDDDRSWRTPEWEAESRRIANLRKADLDADRALTERESLRVQTFRAWAGPEVSVDEVSEMVRAESARNYREQGLLACALFADGALPALRALDVDHEFQDPFHSIVAKTILDQADKGLPHDAATVTFVLRERHQLPIEYDPAFPLRTVDPTQYGLGSWESYALPPSAATRFAQEIRTAHRATYGEQVCIRGQQLFKGYAGAVTAGVDDIGAARAFVAHELIAFPPELGDDLRPADLSRRAPAATAEVVDLTAHRQARDLRMPPPPVLSQAGQAAVRHRGG